MASGSSSGEEQRIAALRAIFGASGSASGCAGVSVAIGDDAAVLDPPRAPIVVSVDEQVEGTHFRRELLSIDDVGYRATMAAASDLAAMGAKPWCAVAALVLPDWVSDEALEALARGQRDACRALGMSMVGGNLARGPVLSIATTVLGVAVANAPLLRSGGKVGDGVWVAGPLGSASLGLASLVAGRSAHPALATAVAAWRRPEARIADGLRAASVAHAAIDVSDGLAKDLGAVCAASGLDAEIDHDALLAHAANTGATRAAEALGADLESAMLRGGEDYALIIASAEPVEGFVRIGTFVAPAAPTDAGTVWLIGSAGERKQVEGGFDHFAAHTRARTPDE